MTTTERGWSAEGIACGWFVEDDLGIVLWSGPAAELRDKALASTEAKRILTEPPLNFTRREGGKTVPAPEMWTGYVPPRLWGGEMNRSRRRIALLQVTRVATQGSGGREAE